MIRIIHVEIATDGGEPFTWVNTPSPSNPDLYAFHKQVEQRQRYLLRVSNLLSHIACMHPISQNHLIIENMQIFFKQQDTPVQVTNKGRWTTYKQGSLTIMTEETQ